MKHMLKDLLRLTGSVCFFLRIKRDGENAASLERKNVCTFTYPYSEIKLRKVAAGTPPLITLESTQHRSHPAVSHGNNFKNM